MIDIEKLSADVNIPTEKLKQFAESYSAKVLEYKEREIAELKAKLKHETSRKHINELQAHINDLREALEKTATKVITDGNPSTTYLYEDIHTALATTPAQSLQEHDNEVIEICAKVLEQMELIGGLDFAEAIRALKVNND